MNNYFHVLFVLVAVYTICLKKTTLCSTCPCNIEVTLFIYLGIKTTSPGSLWFFTIYIGNVSY